MKMPVISIIMPVYNGEDVLCETIESIRKQTFEDFEVVCVDDGSTDGTLEILRETALMDDRFSVIHQDNAGTGAARNAGMEVARGEYMIFLDCGDLFSPLLLEKLYCIAQQEQADVVACNFSLIGTSGKETKQKGVFTQWLPQGQTKFSYLDCPDYIMRITNSMIWNKMYRRSFIHQENLRFDELTTYSDLSFSAVSLAAAQSVAYTMDPLVKNRIGSVSPHKKTEELIAAIDSTVKQIAALPHGEQLKNAVCRFVAENYINALKQNVSDFSSQDAAQLYQAAHDAFCGDVFSDLDGQGLHNNDLYREFCTVRKHDYRAMKQLSDRKVIVSLTTFPDRIRTIHLVLESIFAQTRKPDEIVLWLAEDEFPQKEAELPQELLEHISHKRVSLRWCPDLKPHKKYFYAFREHPEEIVVTIDDDVLYSADMLEVLYKSYLLHPNAVSAHRVHLMLISEQGEILSYRKWIHELSACLHQPSMQLMATGCAGILYPVYLLRKEFLDVDAVCKTCLFADDLWLKAMELLSDVPVVAARVCSELQFVPGTQEKTLQKVNVLKDQNDAQLKQIISWLDEKYEPGIFKRKLMRSDVGVALLGMEKVSHYLDQERKASERKKRKAEDDLKAIQNAYSQANAQMKNVGEDNKVLVQKLERANRELDEKTCRLSELETEISELRTELETARQKHPMWNAVKQAIRNRIQ